MLSKDKRLTALAWAAARAGLSYGRFTVNMTQKDKLKIYKQYQAYLDRKAAGEVAQPRETESKKAPARKKGHQKIAQAQAQV